MSKHFKYVLLPFILYFLFSCNTHKKLVYFQDGELASKDSIQTYSPTIVPDDILSIIVSSENPELAIPYNLPAANVGTMNNSGYTNGIPAKSGYLVDSEGKISMPIIGEVEVGGLTRSEIKNRIKEKLEGHLKDPVVQVSILNYKVTVLGDVKAPGTFKIPNERITILEALGLAGDLNITGNRKNVIVVREIDGIQKEFRVNLTSKKVFSSPVYYLRQNDLVYVEPNRAARANSTFWKTSGSILISTAALIITTVGVIVK